MYLVRSVKRSFWRGLATLLPALLTVIVLSLGISFLQTYVGQYVNMAIRHVMHWSTGIPLDEVEAWYERYWMGWLGLVVAIIGLCMTAYFVGTFLGGYIVHFFESWILRLPLLKKIYPGAKQVSEFFFAERTVEFRRVVAIQYPRMGVWMVGFVTGRSFRVLAQRVGRDLLTVFIPTSPTPVTGFAVTIPKEEVIDLPISVDEAFQYIISVGVIMPPAERMESLEAALMVDKQGAAGQAADSAPPDTRGGS